MSFLNNSRPDRTPGAISGNPLNGLCEKACIQVNKVFDACMKQETLEGIYITVINITPAGLVPPFTFVSAKSLTNRGIISNLTITPLDDNSKLSRVRFDVCIPIEVIFTDSQGVTGKGQSAITLNKDVILHIPKPSVMPYEIEAIVNVVSPEGAFVENCRFIITACVTSIVKVTMLVELLVPTYGYCFIPPCQEFKEEVCEGFFDLPLFPNV